MSYPKTVTILDTTLRDGAQGEGVNFSPADALAVIKLLDAFGVGIIEVPDCFSDLSPELKNAALSVFGSTRRAGRAEDDETCIKLLNSPAPWATVFGKAWDLHVKSVLKRGLDENIVMIYDTIKFLKDGGKRVIFDAEHFFDGYRDNRDYALGALGAALDAGADVITLCDTNGGMFPEQIANMTEAAINKTFSDKIGVHCHNDGGLAVANTLAAIGAGAVHAQGTFIGAGERCGNADLVSVIANLQLKRGVRCVPPESLRSLSETARAIAEIANTRVKNSHPFVGASAFAHKAGMHIDAMLKQSGAYEHIAPEDVGNSRRYLTSGAAGKALVYHKIRRVFPSISKDDPRIAEVTAELKRREAEGFQYEGAEASFSIFVRRVLGEFTPKFEVMYCKTISDGSGLSSAVLKVRVGGTERVSGGEGAGPVNALDRALRSALEGFYPEVSKMNLSDYKVRVLDSRRGTGARVRVMITTGDGGREWITAGVSEDVIEASRLALCDSFEYFLGGGA